MPKFVADSAETTGLKWQAVSSGALTMIKRASFSNVANTGTTFDDVFSSSYKNYMIKIENFGSATSADDVQLQFRYAGPTTQTTGYYGNNVRYIYNSTTITNSNVNDQAQATLNADSGTTPTNAGAGTFFLDGCSGSSDTPRLTGMYMENITANSSNSFFGCLTARVYTGFLMKSSSTNITGTIAVYGLA